MVPEYLAEEFKAIVDENGSSSSIILRVTPYHPTEPGIKFCYESKREVTIHIHLNLYHFTLKLHCRNSYKYAHLRIWVLFPYAKMVR